MTWKEIETRRLCLRPLRPEDEFMLAAALNDFEVSRWLSRVPFPYTRDHAKAFVAAQTGGDPRNRICAIAFKAAPAVLIGVVSYEYLDSQAAPEFGYWLGRAFWRRGLMTEAATALLAHGFAEGIQTFASGYWNPASGAVLRKLGFTEAGFARQFSVALGREVDCVKLRLDRARTFGLSGMSAFHEKGRAA